MKNEIWKDIPGYAGFYQASKSGSIRSISRMIKGKSGSLVQHKGRVIIPNRLTAGYNGYRLSKRGAIKVFTGHRLIMKTFNGNSKNQIDHINGIRNDDRFINLRYCTVRQNVTWGCEKVKHSSIFTGVTKNANGWIARISINGKSTYLGYFRKEQEAAWAYNKKLLSL